MLMSGTSWDTSFTGCIFLLINEFRRYFCLSICNCLIEVITAGKKKEWKLRACFYHFILCVAATWTGLLKEICNDMHRVMAPRLAFSDLKDLFVIHLNIS